MKYIFITFLEKQWKKFTNLKKKKRFPEFIPLFECFPVPTCVWMYSILFFESIRCSSFIFTHIFWLLWYVSCVLNASFSNFCTFCERNRYTSAFEMEINSTPARFFLFTKTFGRPVKNELKRKKKWKMEKTHSKSHIVKSIWCMNVARPSCKPNIKINWMMNWTR